MFFHIVANNGEDRKSALNQERLDLPDPDLILKFRIDNFLCKSRKALLDRDADGMFGGALCYQDDIYPGPR